MNRITFPLETAEVRPADELAELAAQINAEHEAGECATRQGLEHFRAAGAKLLRAKKRCGHGHWLKWLAKNVKFSRMHASRYMRIAREWDKCNGALHLEDALRLLTEDANDPDEEGSEVPPAYVTLEAWSALSEKDRKRLFKTISEDRFNEQGDNENIEWALWSWNPVTGCLHNCPYCYARDIADRFYEQKFAPSLWPCRLNAPKNTPFPEEKIARAAAEHSEARALGLGNVFVCSMADLFGRWVPCEWIEAVLAAVRAAPRWNFLFLTKFPVRMAEFDFPANAWVGTTVDCQARVANAERAFRKVKAGVKWLSIEPMIEPLRFSDLGAFQWIVLGGASGSTQTPAWHPPRDWVWHIEDQARRLGIPFYEKSNLFGERLRGYPGAPAFENKKAPESLRYLPTE
jgi:protein gp37